MGLRVTHRRNGTPIAECTSNTKNVNMQTSGNRVSVVAVLVVRQMLDASRFNTPGGKMLLSTMVRMKWQGHDHKSDFVWISVCGGGSTSSPTDLDDAADAEGTGGGCGCQP